MSAPSRAVTEEMAAAWPISFEDVLQAKERLAPYLIQTPLRHYPLLDALMDSGTSLLIKHENHQPTCSFKVRNGLSMPSTRIELKRSRLPLRSVTEPIRACETEALTDERGPIAIAIARTTEP